MNSRNWWYNIMHLSLMRYVSESKPNLTSLICLRYTFGLCTQAISNKFKSAFSYSLLFLIHGCSVNNVTPNENFCTTYELDLLQSGIGQNLTTHNFFSSIVNGLVGNSTLQKSLACTTCAEGAYAIVRPQLGNSTQKEVDGFFSGICGSSFQGTFVNFIYLHDPAERNPRNPPSRFL